MNPLKHVNENLRTVLGKGDVLLIVPPFTTNSPVIGPHLLQAVAHEQGFNADILYLNLLLASIIGFEFSEKIGTSELFQYWGMLNERFFARSAYGLPPLGKSPEWCTDEAMSVSGNIENHRRMDYDETVSIDLKKYLEIEEICFSFVDEAARSIASFPYSIIGCTARMGQTNCSIALINHIKKLRPEIVTMIGGANCRGRMAEGVASLSDAVDYVFSGESEYSFVDFLKGFADRQLPPQRIITGELVENLDALPEISYEGYISQLKLFFGENTPPARYVWNETSRGCWWGQKKKCTFCSRDNDSIRFRRKSPQKVLVELRTIKMRYPGTAVAMTDNLMPAAYYQDLLPILAEKRGSEEYPEICLYYIKANLKLEDLINLKKARVTEIIPGIESLSTHMLRLINKGVTAADNLLLLRNGRSVGLRLFWFMLWGIPGDTAADYEEILRILPLIRHLQPPRKFFHVHLERFSHYFLNPESHGITNFRPWAVYRAVYPEWADIDKLAFDFIGDYPSGAHEHPELIQSVARELDTWGKAWEEARLEMIAVGDRCIIHDGREPGNDKTHIIDYSRAEEIMKYDVFTGSDDQEWALLEKLALQVDSRYVPLVTAPPGLLLKLGQSAAAVS
jgi:ribosomal peptide maturation radical SAM protein 1